MSDSERLNRIGRALWKRYRRNFAILAEQSLTEPTMASACIVNEDAGPDTALAGYVGASIADAVDGALRLLENDLSMKEEADE